MKRSEMLKHIATELIVNYDIHINFDKAQDMAEVMLSHVEELGMMAPYVDITKTKHKKYYHDDDQFIEINAWEEETDE